MQAELKVPADAVAGGGKAVVEYGREVSCPFRSPLTPSSVPVIPGEVDLTSQMCLRTWLQSATRLPASLGMQLPFAPSFLHPLQANLPSNSIQPKATLAGVPTPAEAAMLTWAPPLTYAPITRIQKLTA